MKTDLSHLPKRKQDELRFMTEMIRKHAAAEMIVLFGSYARNEWVEDRYVERDILVVLRNAKDAGVSGRQIHHLPDRHPSGRPCRHLRTQSRRSWTHLMPVQVRSEPSRT